MQFRNSITRISQLIVDVLQTAEAPFARWVLKSPSTSSNTLEGYTGDPAESDPGRITVSTDGTRGTMTLQSPTFGGALGSATIDLQGEAAGVESAISLAADNFHVVVPGPSVNQTFDGDDLGWELQGDTLELHSLVTGGSLILDALARWIFTGSIIAGAADFQALLQASGGLLVDPNGTVINGIELPSFNANTNAAGDIVVPHNLGTAPLFAVPMMVTGPGTAYAQKITARTATDVTVHFQNSVTGAAPGVIAVSGKVLVIA